MTCGGASHLIRRVLGTIIRAAFVAHCHTAWGHPVVGAMVIPAEQPATAMAVEVAFSVTPLASRIGSHARSVRTTVITMIQPYQTKQQGTARLAS